MPGRGGSRRGRSGRGTATRSCADRGRRRAGRQRRWLDPAVHGRAHDATARLLGGQRHPPRSFAGERALFSIDAANLDRYAGRLTAGTQALLRKYPSFRIDVYPTHRSAAFPPDVAENTLANALRAHTTQQGRAIQGAHAGFPFPLPKDGYEAMWNHLLRFSGRTRESRFRVVNVDAAGRASIGSEGNAVQDYPYWDPAKPDTLTYYRVRVTYSEPARRAGEALLVMDPIDFFSGGRRAWIYLPGQRRVKVAPDVGYDTPNPSSSGMTTFDDAFLFNGAMDRFDFRLVGKREVYVPYNAYQMAYHSRQAELLAPRHPNPDRVRWELHRVWVVESVLRQGRRHLYSRRTFYLDEDSWVAVASDKYDAQGNLFRAGFAHVVPSYEVPAPLADLQVHYDLAAGAYSLQAWTAETGGVREVAPLPEREWSADALAGAGIR